MNHFRQWWSPRRQDRSRNLTISHFPFLLKAFDDHHNALLNFGWDRVCTSNEQFGTWPGSRWANGKVLCWKGGNPSKGTDNVAKICGGQGTDINRSVLGFAHSMVYKAFRWFTIFRIRVCDQQLSLSSGHTNHLSFANFFRVDIQICPKLIGLISQHFTNSTYCTDLWESQIHEYSLGLQSWSRCCWNIIHDLEGIACRVECMHSFPTEK
jgi:hypothetical protein